MRHREQIQSRKKHVIPESISGKQSKEYHVGASPFWWIDKVVFDNSILSQTIEEMFCFIQEKSPYL